MFEINSIVKPLPSADSEYSVCGYSVLSKAKVVDVYDRKTNGNNIKIEILEHTNPDKVGKVYSVDDRYFEAIEAEYEKCRQCPLYVCNDDNSDFCNNDCGGSCRKHILSNINKYCNKYEDNGEDRCKNHTWQYDECTYEIKEVEVIE